MKKQIQNIFLSFSLLIIASSNNPGQQMQHMMDEDIIKTNINQPEKTNMPMPSVSDIFGGMSEDEITKQVQEAQKLFESLSPEEMAEFEKVIEHTLQTMTPQDLEDIQGIAKMVEPHLDLPKEELEKAKEPEPTVPAEKIKDVDEKVVTDSVQTLIDNIKKLVDEVMQKIESNKDLSEEFKHKWTSKITFENMVRQLLTLKQDRLAKKLTKKENQEDKDLVEKIEYFYKELKKLNAVFIIEDSFGITPSKKESDKLLKQTKEILALFEDYIDEMMPLLEKFLRKYDPEALQIAKESEERQKRAKDHAIDSKVKRGSPTAISTAEGFQPPYPTGTQAQPGQGQYPGYYDQYGTPYGYDPVTGQPLPGFGPQPSPTESGKTAPKAKDEKAKDEKADKDAVSYDDISDHFEDFFNQYDNKAEANSLNFLQKDIPAYPQATDSNAITTPADENHWFNSTGKFAQAGFKTYNDNIFKKIHSLTSELKSAQQTIDDVENDISKMPEKELKKLADSQHFSRLQARFTKYQDEGQKAIDLINTQFKKNIDLSGNPKGTITNLGQSGQMYESSHRALVNTLQSSIHGSIITISQKIEGSRKKVQSRIKRHQRKSKAAQSIRA